MDFQLFLEYVPQLINEPLTAMISHKKMAPLERIIELSKVDYTEKNPKKAAVLMLFYPKKGVAHLVLIVRNSYKGVHSSQISFPGGKFEKNDLIFENTALRETEEEIGISSNKIQIVKHFTSLYIPPSNFLVYPFLGICKDEISFVPDPKEVADIIELPLSFFLSEAIHQNATITTSYANEINIPVFKNEEHIVWGATAMILSELKDVLKAVIK